MVGEEKVGDEWGKEKVGEKKVREGEAGKRGVGGPNGERDCSRTITLYIFWGCRGRKGRHSHIWEDRPPWQGGGSRSERS